MCDAEQWRVVPDFPNYEISDLCRVRRNGKILKPVYDAHCRYVRYCFRHNGVQRTKNAHRVMWRAFHGEIPGRLQLNHIDGNRLNNAMTNLELVTQSENALHAVRMGFVGSGDLHHSRLRPERMARGERHGCAKLSEEAATRILALKKQGKPTREIAQEFGVDPSTVRSIYTGKSWSHLTRQQRL